MLLITFILLVVLFYWRLFVVKDLNLLTTVFWIIFPDLASFIPIGVAMRGAKEWPRWGSGLYNLFHTLLVWIPVFAVWSILSGAIQWPLLGWAGHITADRSVGYYLRATSRESRLAGNTFTPLALSALYNQTLTEHDLYRFLAYGGVTYGPHSGR